MASSAGDRRTARKVQNIRLPLIGSMTNRSSSGLKDQRFINVFPETRKIEQIESTKVFMNKRPGLTSYKDFGTGEGRGIIYFNNKFYIAIGNTVYEDGVTPTAKVTLTGSTGPVGMVLGNSRTSGDYLFICDGTKGWVINTSGTVTEVYNDSLQTIVVTSGGTGYGTAPTITFSAPPSGVTSIGTATVSSGAITSISISTVGSGYVSAPTITITRAYKQFDGVSAVDPATDLITVTAHGWTTGQAVLYSKQGLATAVGGLTDATVYYVINIGTDTVKLATSEANAIAGTAINITADGTAGNHRLTESGTDAVLVPYLNSFPTPHVVSPTVIDGYVLLAKGIDIWNCYLDDPTKWSSNDYISAEIFPDTLKALSRQNNQVVAFGESSTEFFYDAANATGSPLSRNESTALQYGVAAPHAIYQNEKTAIFVSQSDSGGRGVFQVDGFTPKKVSDEYVDRILDAEVDMTDCRGYGLRTKGHLFFILNLPTSNRTLVYDPDEKLWHEWSTNSASTHNVFAYNHAADSHEGFMYLLNNSDGTVVKLDPTSYQDVATPILVELTTNRYDMDTLNRKFQSNFRIVGDRYETGNSVNMQFTDDDYQHWSNVKYIDLTDDFPNFARMGSFRRRAYRIMHSANYNFRCESIEVTFVEGGH